MKKSEMIETIVAAKRALNKTWAEIARACGLSEVFTTSACLGQNSLPEEAARKVAAFLDLDPAVAEALVQFPTKGADYSVSQDPLIYRFFEINYVYGYTLKELIHEKMGDGIMSAIDFTMDVEKIEDPKGDRVKVTMNGKFLPYKQW